MDEAEMSPDAACISMPVGAAPPRLIDISSLLICPSGVLYDDTLWWRWLVQLLSRMGLHTHPDVFAALWRREHYDRVCRGEQSYWDALQSFLLSAGLSRGQFDEVWAAGRPRWTMFNEQLRPFPKAPAALQALQSAGYAVAVFAHSPEDGQQVAERFDRMGIRRFFAATMTTRDLGLGPFDAGGAAAALQTCGFDAVETALVSHQPWPKFTISPDVGQPYRVAVGWEDDADAHAHVEGLDDFVTRLFQENYQAKAG